MNQLDEAIAAYRRALDLDPNHTLAHFNLGNALRNKGRLDEAIEEYRAAIGLKPDYAEVHCNLGLLLQQQGKYAEGLAELRQGHEDGCMQPGWRYPSAQWVKEAERDLELERRLPEILNSKAPPTNNSERLALARMCLEHKKFCVTAVRFYEEAFADDPKQADVHRYNAACAAALAGVGKTKDDPPSAEATKAKLREQARTWLRADLATYAKRLEGENSRSANLVQQRLRHWMSDPDLFGLRDPDAVTKLPVAEQEACQKLWTEVEALLQKAREKSK